MRFIVSLNSALRALKNNSKRTMLTMLGIIIGIASVIAILSIGKGFEKDTISNLTKNNSKNVEIQLDFIPTNTNLYETNTSFFNNSDITYVKSVDGVKNAEYAKSNIEKVTKNILIKNKHKSKQISLFSKESYQTFIGRSIQKKDNIQKNKVAVVDDLTARELYGSPSNSINNNILIDNTMFIIVGVYKLNQNGSTFNLQQDDNVQIPLETYNFFLGEEKDTTRLTISLLEDTDTKIVKNKILNKLENSGFMREMGKYQIFDTNVLTESMKSILNSMTYFIGAVAGISLLIAGVGIMNMMYISVYERTREIAIKRAIGSTKRNILFQFLLEGIMLTISGGIIGYLVGIVLAKIIGKLFNITIFIDVSLIMLVIGISSAIGLIFTIVPAYEASRKALIDILR
ncbi:ABC transporter permease [Bacillus wiedmannii]|uniref:ABC transporter permease n=1 Tax=Bacillus wiedmannii TaxID=1890302 RepID=UPI001CBD9A73|nr:ABC transporter permease [Bacillus wiedmannii]MBZ4226409.1 ABC transporter permease [Bacillus wiedmannii]